MCKPTGTFVPVLAHLAPGASIAVPAHVPQDQVEKLMGPCFRRSFDADIRALGDRFAAEIETEGMRLRA